jgi:heme oxygenase (biliverdin-IX-beta and delta-forming)
MDLCVNWPKFWLATQGGRTSMNTDSPISTLPPQTLRFRLRDSTRDIHRRLDFALESQGLMAKLEGYQSILMRFLGLYRPLEADLAGISWGDSRIDIGDRMKSSWLGVDLQYLGMATRDIEQLPDCRSTPRPASMAEGLGVLYVLEGATLGGQVIARQLYSRLGIGAENGGRFFAAYGEKTGVMWRQLVAALDRFGEDDTAATAIERMAVATFQCFENWMNGGQANGGERR